MREFAIALTMAAVCSAGYAQVIDFEDAPGSGNPIYENVALVLGDYEFISEHLHTIDNPGGFGGAENDSRVYMGHEGGSLGRVITMTRTDGGAFDVFGLDGAELWIGDNAGFPNASMIRVTGYFHGGGSITEYLALDGLLDGPGGIDDFETFSISGFTNLISFEMNGVDATGNENFAFGVDNIRLVPAPSTAMACVLTGIALLRRRR